MKETTAVCRQIFGWNSGVSTIDGQHFITGIFEHTYWINRLTPKMPLGLFFLISLILSYLPLSLSYRDGARSESCYNMMVMHRNFQGQIVSPFECGNPCHFQLILIGKLADCRLGPFETTYQCGETYHLRLMSSESSTFEGFMVEARESSDFFGEGSTMHQEDFDNGSTIWGTWVTDPNQVGSGYSQDDFLYHAIECNRSLYSNEGPFENAATQNSPADLRSIDLYWRAPPPPNSSEEYQQLPQQIQFWFVAVQQRLTYTHPVPGPRLDRDCIDPIATPTPIPTATPTPTPTPTQIPRIALNNALRVTLPQYIAENFTETVQETFKNTSAMVVNRYCDDNSEQCRETVAVARRRRQVSLIQPSDVIITNIRNNAQGVLEFVMYIQVAGGARVLGVEVLESAVQNGTTDYRNAGFAMLFFVRVIPPTTTATTESPTASGGISLRQITAIIIGSIYSGFGALLILTVLLLFTLLCYKSYKRYRGAELSYTLSSLDTSYWIHNEYAEEENSVPSKKLMFADRESSSPDPLTDNDLQEIVTAL